MGPKAGRANDIQYKKWFGIRLRPKAQYERYIA